MKLYLNQYVAIDVASNMQLAGQLLKTVQTNIS